MAKCDCTLPCGGTECGSGSVERQLKNLEAVRLAANQLIAGVKHRYHLESDDQLTCPHMRQLAKMLEKANG